jgi:hypothetical protein
MAREIGIVRKMALEDVLREAVSGPEGAAGWQGQPERRAELRTT